MTKDVHLFAAAMADVKRLGAARRRHAPPEPAVPVPLTSPAAPRRTPAPAVERDLSADDRTFDRDIDRGLSRGKVSPDAKLDLHGLTLAAAERAVARFLEDAATRDWRVVLIVTGKGLGKGLGEEAGRFVGGRIRTEFVGWLNRPENRARVRSVRPAHLRHGGSGAFYVLLRRRSSAKMRALRAAPQR